MKVFWLSVLLLTSMPAWAVLPWGVTPAEQAMCNVRVYSRLDRSHPNAQNMHHYCDGLRFLDRAYAAMGNKKEMQFYLKESIGGFDTVLRATPESYPLRGEFHVGKARALKLMGRNAEAAAEYDKALRYKLDTPDVYIAIADYYKESGNKKKALELVTDGLKINPDSKGLKRRYTEFGGKLPYPEAADKTASTKESKAEVKPEAGPEVEQQPPGDVVGETADKPTTPPEVIPQAEPPKIGSPTNPYCRFCPD